MIELGRVCIKTAGRDAKQYCVITEIIDNRYVMIDGATRRKRCNIKHLEPLSQVLKIKPKASTEEVATIFKDLGVVVKKTTPKTSKPAKPVKVRKSSLKQKPNKK